MLKHALFAIGILAWLFGAELAAAEDNCSYRKNTLGHYTYTCADGTSGTLRQNNLGHYQDDRTGETYRKNALGHYQSSEGKQTWRKDPLNNWRTDDQVCRENVLGQIRCTSR